MQFIDLKAQYQALKTEIDSQIQEVLNNCSFIMGPQVDKCERALEQYTGAKHALTCSSGTDALVIALMGVGIGPGDEVIVPAFSFFATAEAVTLVGAKPVFVDIEDEYYNIDISQVEAAMTPRTKGLIFVSLYGQTPDVDALLQIGKKYNIHIMEDAAQSFGASYKGKKSCNLTPISCTSFFPAKPLGCYGDGGALFVNDEQYLQAMKEVRVHGQKERYVHTRIGINGRMDSIQCAVINAKLPKFEWEVQRRAEIGMTYTKAFLNLSDKIRPPRVAEGCEHVYGQYTLYVENRSAFEKFLKEKGVPTSIHYPAPMHKQAAYAKHYQGLSLPVSERCAEHVISLPMHAYMSQADQTKVIETVMAAAKVL
jgi:UDP-2-acetamido-2-deoxy-ribo-hexuluronate aminotransferase